MALLASAMNSSSASTPTMAVKLKACVKQMNQRVSTGSLRKPGLY